MTLTEMLTDDECDATLGEFLSDDEYAYLVKSKEIVLNGLFALMMRRIMRLEHAFYSYEQPREEVVEGLPPGTDHLTSEEIGRRMGHPGGGIQAPLLVELRATLNRHSMENGSNTPDFILATFLTDCLNAWDKSTAARDSWYGHGARIETQP